MIIKKIKKAVETVRSTLRFKVFSMNIQLVAAAVIIFAVTGILQVQRFAGVMEETSREQNAVIMDTMTESMHRGATESLQKYVQSQSKVLNAEFWTMQHDLKVLARQVEMVLEHPSEFSPLPVPSPSEAAPGTLSLQLLYSDDADISDPELKEDILRVGTLRNMMLEIVEGSKSLLDCMVSLPEGASIIVDNKPELKIGENGEVLTYNADRRPWYAGAVVHKGIYYTPVNPDNYSNGYEVMAGIPVYVDGKLAAVCGCSVLMNDLEQIVIKSKLGDNFDSCLINENGNVIYSSRQEGELGTDSNTLKSLKESSNADLVTLVNKALDGGTGFSLIKLDGKETYIAYAPIETVGWTQLLMVPKRELNRTAYLLASLTNAVLEDNIAESHTTAERTINRTILIALFLLAFSTFTSMLFANHLVRPINRMTARVSQMRGDDMVFKMEKIYLTNDEIEVLAKAFSEMSEKMKGYVREIVSITAEKQRMFTELSVASEIQANMLPKHFPAFPDRKEFDLYAVMDPAKEVGGDFYDFFLIDDDHLALVMADVSGKGVPAALFMVISKTMIKNAVLSEKYSGPGEILSEVNNQLCEGNEDNMFVTVWLGILTISTGHLVSACAGHEYPVFYRKDEGFVMERDPHGLSLGAMEESRYIEVEWQMNPGDLLFLYTDGVPEATNSEEQLFGNDRMMSALAYSWDGGKLDDLLKDVRRQVDEYVGDAPQFDDLTMMCIEYFGENSNEEENLQEGKPEKTGEPEGKQLCKDSEAKNKGNLKGEIT